MDVTYTAATTEERSDVGVGERRLQPCEQQHNAAAAAARGADMLCRVGVAASPPQPNVTDGPNNDAGTLLGGCVVVVTAAVLGGASGGDDCAALAARPASEGGPREGTTTT